MTVARSGRRVYTGILLAGLVLAGCGGGDGGGTGSSNGPVISNLVTAFVGAPGACQSGGGPGTTHTLTIDFVDAQGDVLGGTFQSIASFDNIVTVQADFAVPTDVVFTGTGSAGTITASVCIAYQSTTTLGETVTLFDVFGNASNSLAATTPRPPGFPQVPRSTRAPGYGNRT